MSEHSKSDADSATVRAVFAAESDNLLAGSYNTAGIEDWWQRPRSSLGGRSPGKVVADTGFMPDGVEAAAIRALAASLAGPGDAT